MNIRLLLVVCLLQLLVENSMAQYVDGQYGRHELSLSVGRISGQQIAESSGPEHGGYFISSATPNYFGTYRYHISKRLALGITAGVQDMSGDYNDANGHIYQLTSFHYVTGACEVLFVYKRVGKFRVYTFLGLGGSVHTDSYKALVSWKNTYTETRKSFNMQCTPIGISVGGLLSVFAELGIGYKGLINGGVSMRVPYKRQAKKSNVPK